MNRHPSAHRVGNLDGDENDKSFSLYPTTTRSMAKWECQRCGYIHKEARPPESCPICGAPASIFEELTTARTLLDAPVRDYMRRDFQTIDANASVWEAAKVMRGVNIGSLIVTIDGKPSGIVTERDILYKVVAEDIPSSHVRLHKIMSSPIVSVSPDTKVREAIEIMAQHNFRRLLVSDHGKAVGMITQKSVVGETLRGAARTSELEKPVD